MDIDTFIKIEQAKYTRIHNVFLKAHKIRNDFWKQKDSTHDDFLTKIIRESHILVEEYKMNIARLQRANELIIASKIMATDISTKFENKATKFESDLSPFDNYFNQEDDFFLQDKKQSLGPLKSAR
jgi:hypothetical protein